jgi:PAS domain S-box-containing protein
VFDLFTQLLESAPEALVIVDARGDIVQLNGQAERLFGYARAELLGRPAETLLPQRFRARHAGGRVGYFGEPQTRLGGVELYGLRKDGSEFPIELCLGPFPTDKSLLVTVVLRDASGRKEIEARLRKLEKAEERLTALNANLERQAEELREANGALVRSNEELDDFAYIASHDLKEPLRGIASYAQFLVEDYADRLDTDGVAKLHTLERLSRRLSDLVDSLHHYARLGRVRMGVAPTDLNEVLAGVLEGLRITLDERAVEVRVPRPLPTLPCDRVYVGEVFHNLIGNAVKYNDRPERWVEVGWTEAAGPGRPAALYVRDNGIGIRAKDLKTIFRIFQRLHGPEQYGGGTGVGLTLAKRIVERHGGRIWAESTPGEGSTFRFTLERSAGNP